jgi:hypothetical protein
MLKIYFVFLMSREMKMKMKTDDDEVQFGLVLERFGYDTPNREISSTLLAMIEDNIQIRVNGQNNKFGTAFYWMIS